MLEIAGEPVDDLGAPAGLALAGEDIAADLPVEQNQFAVGRQGRAHLCVLDALLEGAKKVVVVR